MKISKSKEEDLEKIIEILEEFGGDRKDLDYRDFVVAKEGEKLIGCVRIKKLADCLELASLVVLPEYRKQGIGSGMLKELLTEVLDPVYILCFKRNLPFYTENGFELISVEEMPKSLRDEYERIIKKPFAKEAEVIVMRK